MSIPLIVRNQHPLLPNQGLDLRANTEIGLDLLLEALQKLTALGYNYFCDAFADRLHRAQAIEHRTRYLPHCGTKEDRPSRPPDWE